jgi:hypothetical protein
MNRFVITDQTGKVIAPTGKWGSITDIFIKAGAAATHVALYDGQTAVAANLLSIHEVAAGESVDITGASIQFSNAGAYALVDANTEALVLNFEAAGAMPSTVLSGG